MGSLNAVSSRHFDTISWKVHAPEDFSHDVPPGAFGLFPLLLAAGRWEQLTNPPLAPASHGLELHATLNAAVDKDVIESLQPLSPAGFNAVGGKLSPAAMESLPHLANLKRLNLIGSTYPESLPWLEELEAIEFLILGQIEGEVLRDSLDHLRGLAVLWISGSSASRVLSTISHLGRLVSLVLQNSNPQPTELAQLPRSLLELQMSGSKLAEDHLSMLTNLSSLNVLNVSHTGLAGSQLASAIASWPSLRVLRAQGIDFHKESVESLVEHPSLHTLEIDETVPLEEARRVRPDLLINGIRRSA